MARPQVPAQHRPALAGLLTVVVALAIVDLAVTNTSVKTQALSPFPQDLRACAPPTAPRGPFMKSRCVIERKRVGSTFTHLRRSGRPDAVYVIEETPRRSLRPRNRDS
jgi:hypothetical protein